MKTAIESSQAPKPIGPYSQAIKKDKTLYISGQLPLNVEQDFLVNSDFSLATKQVMENIEAILRADHMDFTNISFCTIFVIEIHRSKYGVCSVLFKTVPGSTSHRSFGTSSQCYY
ncbi:MAG: Rid family hydrolase [Bacteroidales bacterium]|jgi:2-iminobutanoate/2-iminopropanoate deaminase|nr:Rid family hydrolase [Bacteroidales bacterium]